MTEKCMEKKDVIDTKKIKENIDKLSSIDKSLIPQYLDNIKNDALKKQKEITIDNPYYKYL